MMEYSLEEADYEFDSVYRLVGPNCLVLVSVRLKIDFENRNTFITFAHRPPRRSPVSG